MSEKVSQGGWLQRLKSGLARSSSKLGEGITGIQLDMKARGISQDRIVETLAVAKKARLEILEVMNKTISTPGEFSEFAPRMLTVKIPTDKIGKVIGPGGKMINKIQDETGASVDIEEDGTIYVAGRGEGAEDALARIKAITEDVENGKVYMGKVVSIRDFGAFIEVLPGQEALCHVSELSMDYVSNPEDVCKVGDEMEVKVINVDDTGRIKVSRKAVLDPNWEPQPERKGGGRSGGGRDGGNRRGGGGGGRR